MAFLGVFTYRKGTVGGGGVSPLAPTTNLLMDLDPSKQVYVDDGITVATDGQRVYKWSDQSVNNNDGINISADTRPTYVASGLNNRPYVDISWLNGTFDNEWLIVDNSSNQFDVQEMTLIAVLNPPRSSPSPGEMISNSCGAGGVNSNGWSLGVGSNGGQVWDAQMQNVAPIAGSNWDNEPAYTGNTLQVVVWRFSAGTVGHHFVKINNETEKSGSTVSTITYGDTSDVVINGRFSEASDCSDPSIALDQHLYRMTIYDKYLDDTTINDFVGELNTYHNIY